MLLRAFLIGSVVALSVCETTSFPAMEELGFHKRELLIHRIEDVLQ